MRSAWFSRPLAAVAVVAILALTGCSADGDGPVSTSGGDTISSGSDSISTGTPATSSAAPSGTSSSTTAGTPECATADLSAAYRGGQGAAGHVLGRVVLTDTSDHACLVQGFGGLSYVGGGAGKQVGARAERDGAARGPVTLQPGDSASSAVSEAEAGDYGAGQCDPTPVDGFRVYPPDQTASLFVKHPTTGCANRAVDLLTHQAYR